jgi:hypothetical protein
MTPNPDPDAASGQPDEHRSTETAPFVEAPLPKLPERIGRYLVGLQPAASDELAVRFAVEDPTSPPRR